MSLGLGASGRGHNNEPEAARYVGQNKSQTGKAPAGLIINIVLFFCLASNSWGVLFAGAADAFVVGFMMVALLAGYGIRHIFCKFYKIIKVGSHLVRSHCV